VNFTVSDFTDGERELVAELLQQRYNKPVSVELADNELKLDPASDDMTICPALYWSEHGTHFIVCKVGQDRYRCRFFYDDDHQYGTSGQESYTDLQRCVLALLRVQSDHASQSAGVSSGATAADLAAKPDDDEYHWAVVK